MVSLTTGLSLLQVEHTVSELVTGIDIVQSQILIAEGYPLDSKEIGITSQSSVKLNGAAIQCRITTEDPANQFAPDTGRIEFYSTGSGNGVRLDGGNGFTGAVITPYYDSLLVKICSFGRNFEEIKRVLVGLQTVDNFGVALPADWTPGEEVIVPPAGSCGVAKDRMDGGDKELHCYHSHYKGNYITYNKQPKTFISFHYQLVTFFFGTPPFLQDRLGRHLQSQKQINSYSQGNQACCEYFDGQFQWHR